MKFVPKKRPIYGETKASLEAYLEEIKQPKFRAQQILDWLYKKRAFTWEAMSNLPKALRTELEETFEITPSKRILDKVSGLSLIHI